MAHEIEAIAAGYFADESGNVYSSLNGRARQRKPQNNGNGYLLFGFNLNGKRCNCYIHRFVYTFFKGAIPSGLELNHRSGDKSDNGMDNLELVTRQENLTHARVTGLFNTEKMKAHHLSIIGEGNHSTKLTNIDVFAIKKLLAEGVSVSGIANIYNVSTGPIYNIKSGKRWSHVTNIDQEKRDNDKEFATKIIAIRRLLDEGTSPKEIASLFSISRQIVYRIKYGLSYSSIKEIANA